MLAVPACMLREMGKAVTTRRSRAKSLVMSWYGYWMTVGANSLEPASCPVTDTSTTTSRPASMFHSLRRARRFGVSSFMGAFEKARSLPPPFTYSRTVETTSGRRSFSGPPTTNTVQSAGILFSRRSRTFFTP